MSGSLPSRQVRWDAGGEEVALEEGLTYRRVLGSGAYGMVFEARDERRGVNVAVKKCMHVFKSKSVALRTLREIRLLRLMRHDHIVKLETVLEVDARDFNDIYIVLELMDTDLSKLIQSSQPLSDAHIEFFMAQLVSACVYVHGSNVVHRDLKPSNLLINSNCLLKVADFGLARSITQELKSHTSKMTDYVTTRWYRAPEILCGWPGYSKAVDMWSVGAIFAELLGRTPAFPGTSTIDQLERIVSVLGCCPSREFIGKCKSQRRANFLLSCESNGRAVSFRDLYPSASDRSIALLELLLEWEPESRATAMNAGLHPYFTKARRTRAVTFSDEGLVDLASEFEFEAHIDHDSQRLLRQELIKEVRTIRSTELEQCNSPLTPSYSPPMRHLQPGEVVDPSPAVVPKLKRLMSRCIIA